MAKNERSAGVIVVHTTPPHGQRRFLLLNYGRHWDYPKGHVEPGEDDLAAAWRELREETGIADAVRIGDFAHQIVYYFRGRAGLIRKEVVFFLARTTTDQVKVSHEHEGYAFLPYEEALARATYKTAKEVLRAAQAYLESHPEAIFNTDTPTS